MARSGRPQAFLSDDERTRVEAAIAAAERETSAEIRVVVCRAVSGDVLEAARKRFTKLGMHETEGRNAVLILLAVASRRFAILGDEAVHRAVGQTGWDHIRDGMGERFRGDDFGGGLAYAVEEVGKVLAEHFPWREGDVDELCNRVVEE